MAKVYPLAIFQLQRNDQFIMVSPNLLIIDQPLDVMDFAVNNLLQMVTTPWDVFEAAGNILVDENGNTLSDETGDRITW